MPNYPFWVITHRLKTGQLPNLREGNLMQQKKEYTLEICCRDKCNTYRSETFVFTFFEI